MSAGRKAIRAHVVALLKGKIPAVGERVYSNRAAPLDDRSELPAIVVWADREEIEKQQESPLVWRRKLEVRVEVVVRAKGHPAVAPTGSNAVSLPDLLDDLCEAVEQILLRQPRYWGLNDEDNPGFIQDLMFRGMQLETDEEKSSLLGAAALTWEVSYDVEEGPLATVLPDLVKVHVEHDLPGGELPDAADDIDLTGG